jgi:hypothetical protein
MVKLEGRKGGTRMKEGRKGDMKKGRKGGM